MPVQLTAHFHEAAAASWLLDDGASATIGRGGACTLRIDHPSVSREHAELCGDGRQWRVRDLGSKNGTHLDGVAVVDEVALPQGGWLRLGDVYCEVRRLSVAEALEAGRRRLERRSRAADLTVGLAGAAGFGDLLDDSLRAVVELARCERGVLLLVDGAESVVRARLGIGATRDMSGFDGSAGAVARALHGRCAVIAHDVGATPWLASRASVVAGGLSALVCLPLLDGDHALGVVYADRRTPGDPLDTLDLELLRAFADRAALYIAARRASDALAAPDAPDARALPRWPRPVNVPPPVARR